jgi:hypothetical protein
MSSNYHEGATSWSYISWARLSPTLYGTPEIMHGRAVYVMQGWKITDPQTLAALHLPDDEAVIAVPKELMRYLPKENHGAAD